LFFFCGFETWSVTLREEHRPRASEFSVLRVIFGLWTDGVTREWRRLRNEKLYHLYSEPKFIQSIKMIIFIPTQFIYVLFTWKNQDE
jgi:hypothetical protein